MTSAIRRIVIADANVLINLVYVGRLLAFCGLPGFEFIVPENVNAEIVEPAQRAALEEARSLGVLRVEALTDIESITVFAELTQYLGRGEAACLAMAGATDALIASDEKRRFRREVEARLGNGRLIGTADLFVQAIRAGLITVEEADLDKATLEGYRFKLTFKSFRDLL